MYPFLAPEPTPVVEEPKEEKTRLDPFPAVAEKSTESQESTNGTALEHAHLRQSTEPIEQKPMANLQVEPLEMCFSEQDEQWVEFYAGDAGMHPYTLLGKKLQGMLYNVIPTLLKPKSSTEEYSYVPVIPSLQEFLSEIKEKVYSNWNLSVFTPWDINTDMIRLLPEEITNSLSPINVEIGPLNFYNSFGMGYLVCRDSGEVFRRAVAHRAITSPEELECISAALNETPTQVLNSLRSAESPTMTEIALLSRIVEKNITVFGFNENGKLVSDVYFDFNPTKSKYSSTFYLGSKDCDGERIFFPLVRKENLVQNPPEAKFSATELSSQSSLSVGKIEITEIESSSNELITTLKTQRAKDFTSYDRNTATATETNVSTLSETSKNISSDVNDGGMMRTKDNTPEERTQMSQLFSSITPLKSEKNNEITDFSRDGKKPESTIANIDKVENHGILFSTYQKEGSQRPSENIGAGNCQKQIQHPEKKSTLVYLEPAFETAVNISGLINLGNTCYINSTMQAILSLPQISKHELPVALRMYFTAIHESKLDTLKNIVLTRRANNNLNSLVQNRLKLGKQNDAHELLLEIFAAPDSHTFQKKFQITMEETLHCDQLNCLSKRATLSYCQELMVQPNIPLQRAILDSLSSNLVDINCDSCDAPRMNASITVQKTPQCLILLTQLSSEGSNTKRTINRDYSPFEDTVSVPEKSSMVPFGICSFITHTGTTLLSGHYKAYIKMTNGWLCCDDERISWCALPQLVHQETVYMQFFTKMA